SLLQLITKQTWPDAYFETMIPCRLYLSRSIRTSKPKPILHQMWIRIIRITVRSAVIVSSFSAISSRQAITTSHILAGYDLPAKQSLQERKCWKCTGPIGLDWPRRWRGRACPELLDQLK